MGIRNRENPRERHWSRFYLHRNGKRRNVGKEAIKFLESKHAFGRLGHREEVAAMCMFLASDQASFDNGSYYPVDGGYLAV